MALVQRQAGFSISRLLFGQPSIHTPAPSPIPLLSQLALPSISIQLQLPSLLADLWDGLLKAVPKKKTSHSKRRTRQLVGKALKDVRSINTCPACGRSKLAHHLCPFCVAEIKNTWVGMPNPYKIPKPAQPYVEMPPRVKRDLRQRQREQLLPGWDGKPISSEEMQRRIAERRTPRLAQPEENMRDEETGELPNRRVTTGNMDSKANTQSVGQPSNGPGSPITLSKPRASATNK